MSTRSRRPIRWTLGLIASVVLIVLLAPTTVGGAATFVIVSGSSMEPTYREGDLVVVRAGSYEVGDVVAFRTDSGLVIHRIVGGSGDDGFITQGDNKPAPDTWTPVADDIVGEHFARVPGAGRWALGLASSPMLFGALMGGLGSLLVWSPQRRRSRRARVGGAATSKGRHGARRGAFRGAGVTLAVLGTSLLALTALTAWLIWRPLERTETVERVVFRHAAEFSYTARVSPSVVYDDETLVSPAGGSQPTALFTELLEELVVELDYDVASGSSPVEGSLYAMLRVGAGEGSWTRRIPLLDPTPIADGTTSVSFPVDVRRLVAMVARAESETDFVPGSYQVTVVAVARLDTGEQVRTFQAELPMELRGTLLLVYNDTLTASGETTESVEAVVPNDIELWKLVIPVRWARAGAGALLAMTFLVTLVYYATIRPRLGRGELARARLRYGPMIVPVHGELVNGHRPLDVDSMADLVRLARRAEQMLFHQSAEDSDDFLVPDGPVMYRYRIPREARR